MLWLSRQSISSVGTALAVALLSLTVANAEGTPDNTSARNWDEVFAQVLPDKKISVSRQMDWLDDSALSYAKSKPSSATLAPWVAQPLPAVDGINAKIDGYGGGANHSNGFYGTSGSLAFPLAHQWGAQIDGGIASGDGTSAFGGAGHLFWRDPSIGLLGAYGSYAHWNGTDFDIGHISADTGRVAAEGEYYSGRWTLSGLAGVEAVHINAPAVEGVPAFSIPNSFFDSISASYYVTDDFKLSIGHVYTYGVHFLTLGSEYGFALGGGRMASLFVGGSIGEGGANAILSGVRIYFGQRDKTLIDRHRQDDPPCGGANNAWVPGVGCVNWITGRRIGRACALPKYFLPGHGCVAALRKPTLA
jgi:hypothetical protein